MDLKEVKTCRKCGKELNIENFWIVKKNPNTGTISRKADCKECLSANKGNKPYKRKETLKKEVTTNIIEHKETSNMNFSIDEIAIIKTMIEEYKTKSLNQIVSSNDLIEILKNKANRIKTIINLDTDLKETLKEFSEKNNINMSDSVNYILSEYFKFKN